MKKIALSAVCVLACLSAFAAGRPSIEMLTIGNAGNKANSDGNGRVDYVYEIGKYEVSNSEYIQFLNSAATKTDSNKYYVWGKQGASATKCGIERAGAGTDENPFTYTLKSGKENKPAIYITAYAAARFCNWLETGDANSGAYDFGTYGDNFAALFAKADKTKYHLPTLDEWVKAAYYNPNTDSYQKFATDDGTAEGKIVYQLPGTSEPEDVTINEDYANPNGTVNQNGNVFEWIGYADETGSGFLLGGYYASSEDDLWSQKLYKPITSLDDSSAGFRVARGMTAPVPEPAAIAALLGAAALAAAAVRRKASK